MKVKVRCTYVIEVDVPVDGPEADLQFIIEENGCPGTGSVGLALERHMAQCESESVCWACALGGTNEIVSEDSACR